MESSHEWRSGVYAGAGFGERSDHAHCLRAHRPVSCNRRFESNRALPRAPVFRHHFYRDSLSRRNHSARLADGNDGREWFEKTLLPRFAPVTISALLATLVCIFAFQAENITG